MATGKVELKYKKKIVSLSQIFVMHFKIKQLEKKENKSHLLILFVVIDDNNVIRSFSSVPLPIQRSTLSFLVLFVYILNV